MSSCSFQSRKASNPTMEPPLKTSLAESPAEAGTASITAHQRRPRGDAFPGESAATGTEAHKESVDLVSGKRLRQKSKTVSSPTPLEQPTQMEEEAVAATRKLSSAPPAPPSKPQHVWAPRAPKSKGCPASHEEN